MIERTNPDSQTDALPTEVAPALPVQKPAPPSLASRTARKLVLGTILMLAVFLRLGFVDLPKAWARFGNTGEPRGYYPCFTCPCPPGDDSGDDDDNNPVGCSSGGLCRAANIRFGDTGMPRWWVSEPWINLWLKDTPLFYQPSHGPRMEFQLLFRNSHDDVLDYETKRTDIFSLGQNWTSPWRRYVKTNAADGTFDFLNGLGGSPVMTNSPDGVEYRTRTSLAVTNAIPQLDYPSGARDVFGWKFTGADGIDRYFLTNHLDPNGNSTQFTYTNNSGVACLVSIKDVDNQVTTFTYTNLGGYQLISQVADPYGHTAILQYDPNVLPNYPPNLTNITDAAGLSTSFSYDNTKGLTNMTSPYGTTTFTVRDTWIHVNELGVRDHLFLYVGADGYGQITNSLAGWVPGTSPFANNFDSGDSDLRNSFYWGPRQYALLSAGFVSTIDSGSPDLSLLYRTNYLQARQRHWLLDGNDQLGQTLSLQATPSPDGVIQGQITWYDYEGKPDATHEGTMILPLYTAWKLPNGESRFLRSSRNRLGPVINSVETYSDSSGNPQLRTNIMVYSADNIDLLAVTNASGVRAISNVFNAYHQVTTNYNALDETTLSTYDASHRLTSVKTPSGLTTTNFYGADGYLSKAIDLEISRTNSFTWSNASLYSHTNELGLTITNIWDGLNRLRKITYSDGTYVTNVYSKLDLVQVIDRMGFTNSYGYNGFRQKTTETNALGRVTTFSYCDCGILDSITDAAANTTSFLYDYNGRRTRTVFPDGSSVSNRYNLMGRLTNVIDSAGVSVTNWFNNQGLQVASSNAFGQVFKTVYDIENNETSRTDPNGVTITSTFDNLNRPLTRTYPDDAVEKFGYSTSVLVAYTNQLNQITRYVYDAALRRIYETNANAEVTAFTYDAAGNLLTLTDGKNQTNTWNYNQYGLATNKVDAASNVLSVYQYDPNNRLTNRYTPAKGNTVYHYDAVGNLTNIDYAVSPDITLKYDSLNRLTNMVDAAGTTVYGYTVFGAVQSEDGPWADDTVTYSYDNGRRRSGLSLLQPSASAWTNGYGYDLASRLTNVTSQAGVFTYAYDPTQSLQVKKLNLPNGSAITNAFDGDARLLVTVLRNSSGTLLNSHSYAYNFGNQRTQQVFAPGNYTDYTYDNIGQLVTAKGKESGGTTNRLHEQFGYAYDAAGNLNYRTNNALVQIFNVNSLNELTTNTRSGTLTVAGTTTGPATNVTVNTSNAFLYADYTFASSNHTLADGNNAFTAIAKDSYGRADTNAITVNLPSTNSYVYDLNGNLRTNGTRTFDYDDENQLITITESNAWKSEFTYDGKMRRRTRREYTRRSSSWVQTNEVRYIYDGNLVIQERDANNLPQVSYTRGRDLSGSLEGAGGIGGLLARTDNPLFSIPDSGAHAYYGCDGNGNITCLINTNQQVVARYLYDPFGNALSISGPLAEANLYRFSGKEFHSNSGLICYLYRFYSPILERWVNPDPIAERGGRNLYVFLRNDALDRADPSGLEDRTTSRIGCQVCGTTLAVAFEAMQQGFEAANAAYPSGGGRHEALRHCVASAMLAAAAGCDTAECIGSNRERIQDLLGQSDRNGRQGMHNNKLGRECAGCKGDNASRNPMDVWRVPPGSSLPIPIHIVHFPEITLDQAIACCQQQIANGRADTGGP